jgi:hypothetical protein
VDVDRDGRLDCVTVLAGAGSIAVLLGRGDGTFSGAILQALPADADPSALVVALLDADGVPDLAVTDATADAVHLFRGFAGGTFSFLESYALDAGSEPSAVVAADLDADGRTDLAVADRARSSVSVALGVGDLTFLDPVTTTIAGGFRPEALVTGDFDRDGLLDVAASSGTEGTVAVLRGRGDGTFRNPLLSTASPGANLVALVAADFDGDARLDVAAAGALSSAVFVLLGDGDGTFGPAAAYPSGPQPSALAVGDLDRDGALDLVASILGMGGVSIRRGRGDGTFGAHLRHGTAGTGGAGVALGDLDRNGSLDLVCANSRSHGVGVALGHPHRIAGEFDFLLRVPFGSGHAPQGGVLADVDRDGRLDLLAASRDANALTVALATGGGTFAVPVDVAIGPGSGPVAVAAADFDADGRLDAAVANEDGNDVSVLLGDGAGDFAESDLVALGGGAAPSAVAAADVDRDGLLDLVVALRGTDRVAVALGLGDGTFDAPLSFDLPPGADPEAVVVADVDRDGGPDVVAAGPGSSSVAVFLWDPFLLLGPPLLSSVGSGVAPRGLAPLDLDADGRLDLAVADPAGGTVVALLGAGDGTFLSEPGVGAGAGASAVAGGDFDRHGADDVVAARFASDRARVLLGVGDGRLVPGLDLDSGGDGPVTLLVADLDRDGRLDLVVLHATSDEAVVLRGS